MNPQTILEYCRRAGTVGAVRHEEFAAYVIGLSQRKKDGDQWVNVETPYMSVDGRIAMANEDHRRQGMKLNIGPALVILDDEAQLTLQVGIESEIYGTRHGIATSRKIAPEGKRPGAEQELPWEVAETSAIGRALGQFGYGIFPGSGLATAEDIARVESNAPRAQRKPAASKSNAPQQPAAGQPPTETKVTYNEFWKVARAFGFSANAAQPFLKANTADGETDWAGALRDLQTKADAEGRKPTANGGR